ncbi:MAG: hypothetical protein ACRCYQ_10680 [Nocardioides sp.]
MLKNKKLWAAIGLVFVAYWLMTQPATFASSVTGVGGSVTSAVEQLFQGLIRTISNA